MKIYNYDQITGEFLSEEDADKNPRVNGEFLVPANATHIAPPEAGVDEVAMFKNGAWELTPDHRGLKYFSPTGERLIIIAIGDIVPDGHTTTPPPNEHMVWNGLNWADDLETLRLNKLASLKAAADTAFESLTSTYPDKERESWSKQEAEAKAWNADNTAGTPFIDAYATASGMPKADIVSKILAKVAAFETASGAIVGQIAAKRADITSDVASADSIRNVNLNFTA